MKIDNIELKALAYEFIKNLSQEFPSENMDANDKRFYIGATWIIAFVDFIEKKK